MADFTQYAYDWYIKNGLPPHQAAALAAHAQSESGGNTRAVHDSGTGVGIFGFRDPKPGQGRKTDLFNYAASDPNAQLDPYNVDTQLAFSLHEMRNKEKAAGDRFFASKDYGQAIDAGMGYLRPQGYSAGNPTAGHNYTGRFNAGAQLAGVQPITGPAIASAGGDNNPQGGLLQPQGIDADINAWGKMGQDPSSRAALDKVLAADKAKTDSMYGGIAKAGAGLAEASIKAMAEEPQRPMQPMQASFHAPQTQELQGLPLPDFEQQLAQSRLALFPQKKKPWEFE